MVLAEIRGYCGDSTGYFMHEINGHNTLSMTGKRIYKLG